jgi:uncharacterized phage protein (TIGR01671 family)
MREILFRAKGEGSDTWLYGYYARLRDTNGMNDVLYAPARNPNDYNHTYGIIPETVGQYTDLKDCNGNEIFEGDIIKTIEGLIGVVEWDDTFAKYIVCYNQINGNWFDFEGINCYPFALDCTIIGNIYDNPELLERSD